MRADPFRTTAAVLIGAEGFARMLAWAGPLGGGAFVETVARRPPRIAEQQFRGGARWNPAPGYDDAIERRPLGPVRRARTTTLPPLPRPALSRDDAPASARRPPSRAAPRAPDPPPATG